MAITVAELAEKIGGICEGDGKVKIYGIAGIKDAGKGQITFIANMKYVAEAETTQASAIIVPMDLEVSFRPIIRSEQPKMAVVKAIELLTVQDPRTESMTQGVHPLAFIGKEVSIGKESHIGPYAVIQDSTEIGEGTLVYPGCCIGPRCKIGNNCVIFPNVTIRNDVQIGDRVIIYSGSVVGSDGFGYTEVDGKHFKVPQTGIVVIEDDVEIGSNVSIDRATFDRTWIKKGTKIDNLVQIAHNVVIGENCIIVAQVGIAGSTEIGDNVKIAGQVAITGHIKIGSNTVITGRSAVTKSIPENSIYSGSPARIRSEDNRILANIQRLPDLAKRLLALEKKVEESNNQNCPPDNPPPKSKK